MSTGRAVPDKLTANVPLDVIGEPVTAKKAGTDMATEVTVPPADGVAEMVIPPELFVMLTFVPAVKLASAYPEPLPMATCPFVGVAVNPVPPYRWPIVAAFHTPAANVPTPVMPVYEPLMRPVGSVPDEILDASVVSVVAEAASPDTAPDAMAMAVLATDVSWPCAFTAKTGTCEADPYAPAATPVLAMLNV